MTPYDGFLLTGMLTVTGSSLTKSLSRSKAVFRLGEARKQRSFRAADFCSGSWVIERPGDTSTILISPPVAPWLGQPGSAA